MKSFLFLFIALKAIDFDLYAAEAGMPQLDPTYWVSQAFWLILIFSVLYISISKFYLPTIKNNLDKMHLMADALMKYETIDSDQIDQIMEGKVPDAPDSWSDDDSSSSGKNTDVASKDSPSASPAS